MRANRGKSVLFAFISGMIASVPGVAAALLPARQKPGALYPARKRFLSSRYFRTAADSISVFVAVAAQPRFLLARRMARCCFQPFKLCWLSCQLYQPDSRAHIQPQTFFRVGNVTGPSCSSLQGELAASAPHISRHGIYVVLMLVIYSWNSYDGADWHE